MNKPRALVVASEKEDRSFLRQALEGPEWASTTFGSGYGALDTLRETPFDVVVATQELENGLSGLRVARAVKWRWPKTSVIILGDGASFAALRAALNLGVDGYLLKPVDETELRAAIQRALLSRWSDSSADKPSRVLRWCGLALDRQKNEIVLDGEPIHLTNTEFKLLRYLMENENRVVAPQELFEISHGHPPQDRAKANDAIRWHIHNLRRKIEPEPRRPIYIHNVYGRGYTFAGIEGVNP